MFREWLQESEAIIKAKEDLIYFVGFNDCLYDEYLFEGRRQRLEIPSYATGKEAEYAQYHDEREEAPWRGKQDHRWRNWFSKNPKINKSDLKGREDLNIDGVNPEILQRTLGNKGGYHSYIIHLTPAAQSGFITCACASQGCRTTCLQTAGNIGALADKTHARLKKTWYLAKEMPNVVHNLIEYIRKLEAKTEAQGAKLALRLNGTSDINWESLRDKSGRSIIEEFPNVIFYDYTKEFNRMGKTPPNYHLTFSRSELNERSALKTLKKGHNVAVVFGPGKVHNREKLVFPKGTSKAGQTLLPSVWFGYKVINGDVHDLRFLEQQPEGSEPVVIGLIGKGAASFENYDRENLQFTMPEKKTFMVMPNDPGIKNYPDNEEFIRAATTLMNKRNKSKANKPNRTGQVQYKNTKEKYHNEQELITGLLAGTLTPEQEAEAIKSPHYARLQGALAGIRSYCEKFPSRCKRDYLKQARGALLNPAVDPVGDITRPAMSFDMDQLKQSGIISGNEVKRTGNWWEEEEDSPQEKEQEFHNWLARREQKPQPGRIPLPKFNLY